MLIQAVMAKGWLGVALIAAIVVSSLMAVYYIWRVVETIYFRDPPAEGSVTTRRVPFALLTVTWIAALANVFFGLVTALPLSLATTAAQDLAGMLP